MWQLECSGHLGIIVGAIPVGVESPLFARMGGISALLCQGLISLSWNSVTFGMLNASSIDIYIVALVSCSNPEGPQLSSRLFLPTVLFKLFMC